MSCSRGCCPDQRTHYLSIAVSAAATPTSKGAVASKLQSDKRFDKDGSAYWRLKKDGIQPDQIDGSAQLEATL